MNEGCMLRELTSRLLLAASNANQKKAAVSRARHENGEVHELMVLCKNSIGAAGRSDLANWTGSRQRQRLLRGCSDRTIVSLGVTRKWDDRQSPQACARAAQAHVYCSTSPDEVMKLQTRLGNAEAEITLTKHGSCWGANTRNVVYDRGRCNKDTTMSIRDIPRPPLPIRRSD